MKKVWDYPENRLLKRLAMDMVKNKRFWIKQLIQLTHNYSIILILEMTSGKLKKKNYY